MSFNGDLYPTAGADVVMTTKGDVVRFDSERERYGIGSTGQVMAVSSGLPAWTTLSTADSVLTTQGDILYEGAAGLARLGQSTDGFVLTTKGASANPVWAATSGVSLSADNTWTGTQTFNSFIDSTPTTLTIASARITATRLCHKVDTEGAAATDYLDWIDGYGAGRLLSLQSANAARDPTLRDEQGGVGTMNMNGDYTLTNFSDTITFIGRYQDGQTWCEISRSDNG